MAIAALTMFFLKANTVYASGISQSKLATGTQKLIGDATSWLMILAPVVAGLLIIYFCIRRSAADEMDQKKWNNRIVVGLLEIQFVPALLGLVLVPLPFLAAALPVKAKSGGAGKKKLTVRSPFVWNKGEF